MCHKKVMIIVALNFSGQTYHEILEDGGTINAGRYIKFLDNCFNHLQGLGIVTERIHWMHDNARPHKAAVVEDHQPPYSPDVNLLDWYVFLNMENYLRSHDFDDIPSLRQFVQDFLQNLTRMALSKEFEALKTDCARIIEGGGS